MMDEFAKVIFESAVLKERAARKMYLELAEKADSEEIKKVFSRIAEEELIHETLFSKMNIDILKIVSREQLSNLNLLKDIDKDFLPEHQKQEIIKIIDFAIKEEESAYNDYSILINHLNFGEARIVLQEIAKQELKHKELLEKARDELHVHHLEKF